jgi:hypothetical protein
MYDTVEGRVVREELTKVLHTWGIAHALMSYTMAKKMSSIHLTVRVIVPHFESEEYIGIAILAKLNA